ncbi:DUF6711 family protein [Carnobacterium antarcticum]|uniref:DUF6711 family protein n=1 Tax=Carnobacterium antarcticum TaxID=2126436 RepID=A0ABW4NN38_9LACT|nr:DUF6711 family protein [Carnobacterium sp. CP1]ALV20766.1 hypothetical protein NY10_141 [Carnobacterium sp. CP1]
MAGSLAINGASVKQPKSFNFGVMDLDGESTRNAKGKMTRDIIRTGIRKIELEWGPLSDGEISSILQAVNVSFFSVSYPDAMTGGQRTGTFYVGDRSAPSYSWNDKYKSMKWEGLSMNFIEQ